MRTKSRPLCSSLKTEKNSFTYYGKQNHRCKTCKCQFVERSDPKGLSLEETVKKLLLERISLRGICRVINKSLGWLSSFINRFYGELGNELPIQIAEDPDLELCLVETDEIWSFVGKKADKQWI